MATCKRIEVMPPPPPVGYQLTLNEDEARILRRLLFSHIGFSCAPTRDIELALGGAGIRCAEGSFRPTGEEGVLSYVA